MCSARVELMRSIIAASVVDLPEPVTPVTRINPRGMSQTCSTILGKQSSSSARILVGIIANFQVQVGGAALHGDAKQIINIHSGPSATLLMMNRNVARLKMT